MRRISLLYYGIAVLAFAALIIALTLWPKPSGDNKTTPDVISNMSGQSLVSEPSVNVLSVTFMPLAAAEYAILRDSGTGVYMLDSPDAIFPGKQSDLERTFFSAIRLVNLTLVTEAATDEQLDLFGFDQPVVVWRIDRAAGPPIELMAGAEQAVGSGRYVRKTESREVFLVTETQSSFLTGSMEDMYDLMFVRGPDTGDSGKLWEAIDYCLLERGTGTIEVRKRTEEEYVNALVGTSRYHFVQPFVSEGNDYLLQSSLLEPIAGISPGYLEEAFPADLSIYGLDAPVRLTLECVNGWTGTLLIGDYDARRSGRFVMIDGYDAVLVDDIGDYGFLNVEYAYIRSPVIWLYNISDVSSVDFLLCDITRTLTFEHDDEDKPLRGWLDGSELSELNSRRLFRAALSVTHDSISDAGVPAGLPDYRITIHFLDGGSDHLELYRISQQQFRIVCGGRHEGLIINNMTLQQNLLSRFDILDSGGDIPAI